MEASWRQYCFHHLSVSGVEVLLLIMTTELIVWRYLHVSQMTELGLELNRLYYFYLTVCWVGSNLFKQVALICLFL